MKLLFLVFFYSKGLSLSSSSSSSLLFYFIIKYYNKLINLLNKDYSFCFPMILIFCSVTQASHTMTTATPNNEDRIVAAALKFLQSITFTLETPRISALTDGND